MSDLELIEITERDRIYRRIAELEAALNPFAKIADAYMPTKDGEAFPDSEPFGALGDLGLKVGDFRRARAALGKDRAND